MRIEGCWSFSSVAGIVGVAFNLGIEQDIDWFVLSDHFAHIVSSNCCRHDPTDCEPLAADGDMSAGDFWLR